MAQKKGKPIGENGLRIVSLTAENFKRLVAIEIRPDGRRVDITGRNKQGKTSVLDAIQVACDRASVDQRKLIRDGESEAVVTLDLGEIVVTRRITEKGDKLSVESAEGARFTSPQTMLDQFFGKIGFDPHQFLRMEDKDQVAQLKQIAQLDVDIDELEGQERSAFDRRTTVNRDAKVKRNAAAAITVASGLPDQPIDDSAILDRLQAANDQNADIQTRKTNRENAIERIGEQRENAEKMKRDADKLNADASELRRQADALDEQARQTLQQAEHTLQQAAATEQRLQEAGALPEPIDVTGIRVELEHARQVNQKIQTRDRQREIQAEAEQLEAEAAELTQQIDDKRKAIADAIARAKMPVPGLGFADGRVTFNGFPFNQASAAEQLQVSFAIAKSANPTLRVVLIRDASLLDDDSLAQLEEMAKDGDYQIWLERVDGSGKVGFYIEDGAVAAVNGHPAEQPGEQQEAQAGAQSSLV
jgi:hypothetical protein